MLPAALLSLEPRDEGRWAPRYLGSRDEVWVAHAISYHGDLVDMPFDTVARAWCDRIEPALRASGVARKPAMGVKHLLDGVFRTEIRASLPPPRIREVLFEAAARGGTRDEVLARAGVELGLRSEEIEAGLFADRPGERILVAPEQVPSARELVGAYNLALVQGLLLRSDRVRVEVSEMVRSVVRYAKLRGLLATFAAVERGGLRMEASGPLALFRHTLKYGHALAMFFPVLVSTPSYRLDALCTVQGDERHVVVRAGDPVPRTHAIPRDADSAIERALVRDVRQLGTWEIERETEVVRAGHRLFFPDFTLTRGADRVLVEIVGYHTREYLERKTEALRAAADRKLIVCVEESLDCGDGAALGGKVLFFRRRVNAQRLLHVAEALVQGRA